MLFLDIKKSIYTSQGKIFLFPRKSGKKILFLFKSHGKCILLGEKISSYQSEP